MSNTSENRDMIDSDWDSTSWEGCERLHLQRQRQMSLREKILALEGMAEVAERFRVNFSSKTR